MSSTKILTQSTKCYKLLLYVSANSLVWLSISAANKTLNLDFLIQESEHTSGKSHGEYFT